jgi:hypothetical protein
VLRSIALLLSLLFSMLPLSVSPASGPNWSRQEALEAAARVDQRETLRDLFELARTGRDTQLLEGLRELAGREDWPVPAREAALFHFAAGLGDLLSHAVGPEVLAFLADYEPRTLVAHEEHPGFGVPLFNIRAATAGVEHAWERDAAGENASRWRRHDPAGWLAAYLAASPAQREGYVDALNLLPENAVRLIAERSLSEPRRDEVLTPVTLRAALRLADPELFTLALEQAAGPGLADALGMADTLFMESERLTLLEQAVRRAPAPNAALSIAQLAPGLLHQPAALELIIALLGDRELGASAALALSHSTDPNLHERLYEVAGKDQGLASERAALALSLAQLKSERKAR